MTEDELQELHKRKEAERQALIEAYEERAAIMEYEANMPRKQAERAAYYDWRKQFPKVIVPVAIREKLRLSETK